VKQASLPILPAQKYYLKIYSSTRHKMPLPLTKNALRFIDLFCGIGWFRIAAQIACHERNLEPLCVFSSDIDPDAQTTYIF
jgi:hypothetical protein